MRAMYQNRCKIRFEIPRQGTQGVGSYAMKCVRTAIRRNEERARYNKFVPIGRNFTRERRKKRTLRNNATFPSAIFLARSTIGDANGEWRTRKTGAQEMYQIRGRLHRRRLKKSPNAGLNTIERSPRYTSAINLAPRFLPT